MYIEMNFEEACSHLDYLIETIYDLRGCGTLYSEENLVELLKELDRVQSTIFTLRSNMPALTEEKE